MGDYLIGSELTGVVLDSINLQSLMTIDLYALYVLAFAGGGRLHAEYSYPW